MERTINLGVFSFCFRDGQFGLVSSHKKLKVMRFNIMALAILLIWESESFHYYFKLHTKLRILLAAPEKETENFLILLVVLIKENFKTKMAARFYK